MTQVVLAAVDVEHLESAVEAGPAIGWGQADWEAMIHIGINLSLFVRGALQVPGKMESR